ncbi:hypothetical protein SAMN04487948_10483 [Halogranum amylolyticum]|uniref:Uncharacterized protein n=1 Tax=Halogranum amylolyticum TaxID=660520 RepID=A0A1H8RKU2_9EURY|nr:hypothetical protein [Halogranum amylolyticum]SEO66962.1 hypothetical protein SAMN04487948_10483 [Halogranum amylolyticum]
MQRSTDVERSQSMLDDSPSTSRGDADTDESRSSGGRLAGARRRVGRLFSIKVFLGTLLLAVVGMALGSAIPLVGIVGRFVGLFGAGFLVGLVATHRRYLEVGAAGGVASGLGIVLSTLGSAFLPVAADLLARHGVALAGGGAVAGVLVALLGHYFGRDLRDGLTRDVV